MGVGSELLRTSVTLSRASRAYVPWHQVCLTGKCHHSEMRLEGYVLEHACTINEELQKSPRPVQVNGYLVWNSSQNLSLESHCRLLSCGLLKLKNVQITRDRLGLQSERPLALSGKSKV